MQQEPWPKGCGFCFLGIDRSAGRSLENSFAYLALNFKKQLEAED